MKSKVFINTIDKNIKNNKDFFHFKKDDKIEIIDDSVDINLIKRKINDIFNSDSFVYKIKVEIILKDGSQIIEDVIAIKDNNLITLSDKKININEILNIKKAN